MKKRNHKMATRSLRLHPFERQRMRQIWSERTLNASIHALNGEDLAAVLDKTGSLFYVVLGAAMIEQISPDTPDMRILRATANTLGDLTGADQITHQQRGSLSSGLEALRRLVAGMNEESLFVAATHAQQLLSRRPVTLADFEALGERRRAA